MKPKPDDEPFGPEWEREVTRLSIHQLELVFDMESGGMKKKEFIQKTK